MKLSFYFVTVVMIASGCQSQVAQEQVTIKPLHDTVRMQVVKPLADTHAKMPILKSDTAHTEKMPVAKPPANVQPK